MAGATLFIASTKPAGQLATALAAWVAELAPEDRLLLLYGGRRLPSGGWPGVDVEQRAGASIYHLRALIPTLAQPGGWAVVLEDHCLPPPGWGRALRDALATASAPVLLAAVTNRRSTETWSWASYLFSFAFHWPPMAATPPGALVAGTAFRVLPADRGPALAPGDFEHDFLRR